MDSDRLLDDLNSINSNWRPSDKQVSQFYDLAKINRKKIILRRRIASTTFGCLLLAGFLAFQIPTEKNNDLFYQQMADTLDSVNQEILTDINTIEEQYGLSF
jgi:hypothetical protein